MFDLRKLNDDLVQGMSYTNDAQNALFDANEKLIAAKLALEEEQCALQRAGVINGKNDTERKAQLDLYTAEQQEFVRSCEQIQREASLDMDLNQRVLDLRRYQLRLAELAAKETYA